MNTFLVPSVSLLQNDTSFGFYGGTNLNSSTIAMGSSNGVSFLQMFPRTIGNSFLADLNSTEFGGIGNSNSTGFLFASRLLSSSKITEFNNIINYFSKKEKFFLTLRENKNLNNNACIGDNSLAKKKMNWKPKKTIYDAAQELFDVI